ncbi:MAG: hypothetical protein Q8N81_02255 [bacterium]|nr:hypothetical protein [bacterium]
MPGEGSEGRPTQSGHQEFGPGELEELRSLRIKQMGEGYTETDRLRLVELQRLQEAAGSDNKPLSDEERAEYFRLTRDQTAGTDWTQAKAARVVDLQRRMDQGRQRGY